MKTRAILFLSLAACGSPYLGFPAPAEAEFDTTVAGAADGTVIDPGDSGAAARALAEADIIQMNAGTLYALSISGTLSLVDISKPGALTLLGQLELLGTPFEMYLRGTQLIVMQDGTPQGRIQLIDVSTPSALHALASVDIVGEIADSRLLGDVLYLGTYENVECFKCSDKQRTVVTSFAIGDLHQIDQKEFASTAPDAFNTWGRNWKRSLYATDKRLYIGGHSDVDSRYVEDTERVTEGIIDVLDITNPSGTLQNVVRIEVAGAILSRWQLDERGGVLRVISQTGAGRTGAGLGDPRVVTLKITENQPATFTQIGGMSLIMPRQEGLRAARFDGDRLYAITFAETDPLFIVDLADPTRPTQKGELHLPGFIYHIEPFGERLLTLGVDASDRDGSLNVSLIDVASADNPQLLGRVAFAPGRYNNLGVVDHQIAEDQDRIQKAFRVIDNGLIALPFSGDGTCANSGGGVQLIDWKNDTLDKRVLLSMPGHPRRAFKNGAELLAVSDSNVRAFSLASAAQTADLAIGVCAAPANDSVPFNEGWGWDDVQRNPHRVGCSQAGNGIWYALVLLGLAVRRSKSACQNRRTKEAATAGR